MKRNSQVYNTKSFLAFEFDNNIAKKRTTQFHQKIYLNNLNNGNKRPSNVIKEPLIQSDKKVVKKKNTVNNNNNSLDYFAKEEKEEECTII